MASTKILLVEAEIVSVVKQILKKHNATYERKRSDIQINFGESSVGRVHRFYRVSVDKSTRDIILMTNEIAASISHIDPMYRLTTTHWKDDKLTLSICHCSYFQKYQIL